MDIFSVILVAAALVVILLVFRSNRGGQLRCNRCDGTGQVSEKWPDPDEPGGWHKVEGTCPKCKGKGTL